MSKIGIIGDFHVGGRNDSIHLMNYQLKFLNDQFVPYLLKHKITDFVCLGDLFDRRQYTNHKTLDVWKEKFFDPLLTSGIKMHVLVGNHDCPFKHTLKANTIDLFLSHYDNIVIYDTPKTYILGENSFSFIPWICQDNESDVNEFIKSSKDSICFGHLELVGFDMYVGHTATEGMSKDVFKSFSMVYSGHYHHRSHSDNIYYTGSPFEFTWADYDDQKGFLILDTVSHSKRFIRNEYSLFHKIEWNDENQGTSYWKSFDTSDLCGKYVKLVVVKKTDPYQFDLLVDQLYNCGAADFKIVEEFCDIYVDDDDIATEDSLSLVESYIDQANIDADKPKLKSMMKSLYLEAMSTLE